MKKYSFALAVSLLIGAGCNVYAQSAVNDSTIVGHIERSSQNRVHIYQPTELGERLKASNGNPDNGPKKAGKHLVGYRIQVFADNNQRTAKSEALSRERNIMSQYPELDCYLTYKAPTWRLRVGDFKTREEAVDMMKQMQKAFPSYSREMIVVVDRINAASL